MPRLLPIITAALILGVPVATARTHDAKPDSTPLSCDGKPMSHHVHRARALIRDAYALERWADETPAKDSELDAFREHKFCVLDPGERRQLGKYREKMVERFKAHRQEQQWLASLTPPGPEWLAALRWCESTNNYSANTGNDFFGAYQFTLSTWASVGGTGYPHLASPAEQDYRAALLYRTGGSGHWPNCP